MSEQMACALSTIESALRSLHRDRLLMTLAPGITPEQVEAELGRIGLPSLPELDCLYGWHNGTAPDDNLMLGDIWIFPIFYFLPLDEAVLTYQAMLQSERWREGWLPVFADGGGDFYVVDLSVDGRGRVVRFRNDFAETPMEFESLAAMMTTLAAAFQRGIFYVDPGLRSIQSKRPEFDRLAAEFNPGVPWWTDPSLA